MDTDDEPVVWPAAGQQLFAIDPAHDYAWVDGPGWYDYTQGFLAGAQALLSAAQAGGLAEADRIALPMVFLYRHFLELTMKGFVLSSAGFVGEPTAFAMDHDLPKLWSQCRGIVERRWVAQYSDTLNAIGEQVDQLAKVDPQSMAFRYPEDKKGRRSLPQNLRSFSLQTFAERVEAIALLLEGLEVGLYEEASARSEMAEEARRDAADSYDGEW